MKLNKNIFHFTESNVPEIMPLYPAFPIMPVSNQYYKAPPSHRDDISVRSIIVYGAYLCTFITCFYSISVASFIPNTDGTAIDRDYEMIYISDGYNNHCGMSIVILGTCTLFVGMSQFIAKCHMDDTWYVTTFFLMAELIGWFVVLGINETGWNIHYIGLVAFLFGNVCFHWKASREPTFSSPYYKAINGLTIFLALVFLFMAKVSSGIAKYREVRSIAVSIEFFVSIMISIEQFFLINALDQFEHIHLTFERRE